MILTSEGLTRIPHSLTSDCHFLMTLWIFCAGWNHLLIRDSCWHHYQIIIVSTTQLYVIALIYLSAHPNHLHCLSAARNLPPSVEFPPQRRPEENKDNQNHLHSLNKTCKHFTKHTWLCRCSCCLCSSENLFSHDALSQAILVFIERISLSVLVTRLWRALTRSGLPGMAAITLLSHADIQQIWSNVLVSCVGNNSMWCCLESYTVKS